jgi:hypothetical protein
MASLPSGRCTRADAIRSSRSFHVGKAGRDLAVHRSMWRPAISLTPRRGSSACSRGATIASSRFMGITPFSAEHFQVRLSAARTLQLENDLTGFELVHDIGQSSVTSQASDLDLRHRRSPRNPSPPSSFGDTAATPLHPWPVRRRSCPPSRDSRAERVDECSRR